VPTLRLVAVKTIAVFEEGRRHQMVRELRALYGNLVRRSSLIEREGCTYVQSH
jgi:hypothetical protein